MSAAVLHGVGEALEIVDDVVVEPPRAGEVKVRMVAAGVCHSDLSMQDGTILTTTPVVLGHEGAGVVEEVGDGVERVEPGDHVVVSWVPQCGECFFCGRGQPHLCERAAVPLMSAGLLDGTTRLSRQGLPLRQMLAAGTFCEVTVVPAISVVKVPIDVDMAVAALLGCAVVTGVGAVLNTAKVAPGASVAVVGCGGVGLNVVQAARVAGASQIIAVDRRPEKLALAEQFGATAVIDAGGASPVGRVQSLTGERGVDVAFEVVGAQETIDQTIAMTRRGGMAVLVGIPGMGAVVNVPAFLGLVLQDKTVRGCWYGSSDLRRDIPRLVAMHRSGQLDLDRLISRRIRLDEVNSALADLRDGTAARAVISY